MQRKIISQHIHNVHMHTTREQYLPCVKTTQQWYRWWNAEKLLKFWLSTSLISMLATRCSTLAAQAFQQGIHFADSSSDYPVRLKSQSLTAIHFEISNNWDTKTDTSFLSSSTLALLFSMTSKYNNLHEPCLISHAQSLQQFSAFSLPIGDHSTYFRPANPCNMAELEERRCAAHSRDSNLGAG